MSRSDKRKPGTHWALALVLPALLLGSIRAQPLFKPEDDEEARQAQAELADIQRRIDKGDLPKIQFDFDKAAIRPEAEPVLDLIAALMLKNPQLKMMIFAHTCNLGTRDYNLKLSQARAKSVKGALVKRGILPPSIRFRGRAFDEPIADNSTEEGREKNRRVEFHIMKRWWSAVY